jgi:salicylate hydroxylase
MRATIGAVDVVVIGGGIGGLATALALSRQGHAVRVLERSAEFAEVGAGLQMAPNATRILDHWGLLDEVVEAGVRPDRLVCKDALDGSVLTHLDLGAQFLARYGGPYILIHRSDLLAILVRACAAAGVDLAANCAVEDVLTVDEHALVRTGHGEHRAALAVAADGLRSRLRAHLSTDEPVCSGYVAYRGTASVEDLRRAGQDLHLDDVVLHIGPRCHLVQYPLRRGDIFNTVAVFASPGYDRGEADWGGPEELDAAFAEGCDYVRHSLRPLWRDRRWPMYDRLPIDSWVDGRMVLTGDAAHPMLQYLAQGACQTIEDAAELAAAVGRHTVGTSVDWVTAAKDYERVRCPRTALVQTRARFWGDLWHVDGIARLIRNELFRDRDPADLRHVDWLYQPVAG